MEHSPINIVISHFLIWIFFQQDTEMQVNRSLHNYVQF